jgi:fumarylpyruvate hydrolase
MTFIESPLRRHFMQLVIDAPPVPAVPVAGQAGGFPVRRIYCVGRNYTEHVKEMGGTGREPPVFFMKPADAIVSVASGTGEVAYPSLTKNYHHEVELVVAIGRGGRDIAVADALAHVWGYAVGLDMTRRDLQNEMKDSGRPWDISKGFDQSAPVGPLSPAAVVPGVHSAAIALAVNGTVRQSSRIAKMVWNVAEIIAHVSKAWALAPGDLIFTGTPEGVGAVVVGDLLEARIEGLAPLAVRVV